MNPNDGQRIVAFYEGTGSDDRGRLLADVLRFDDERLEDVHDFIQWLFPLLERSGANPSAPVLDEAAVEEFRARPELRAALRGSLDRMLAFYGFAWSGDRVVRNSTFGERSANWLNAENHNHLRLSRILRSLCVLGEPRAARALFIALSEIYGDEDNTRRTQISDRTFRFWSDAIKP